MGENRARLFFGTELRRKREEFKLTGKELADALGCTPQWISTMEGGRKISEQSTHDLDTYFKTDGMFHRLWRLATEVELHTGLPPGFPEYSEREAQANSIRAFSGFLVNGLFQTERYARTVLGRIEGSHVDELVTKRLERQAPLQSETPPLVWLTIDEVILHRVIGSPEIMHEQLEALLAATERAGTVVEVMPFRAGYHAGLGGDFTILGFKDGSTVAYTESAGVGTLIQSPDRVPAFVVRWDLLRGYGLSVEESRAAIETAMERL